MILIKNILSIILIVCLVSCNCVNIFALNVNATDAFDGVRNQWIYSKTGGSSYNTSDPDVTAAITQTTNKGLTYWDSMDKSTSRVYLWSDLASTTDSGQITEGYNRIYRLTQAYRCYGSSLANNTTLRDDIISALGWMYTNRYNENKTIYDNDWDWEIGAPIYLEDATALMYDDLINIQPNSVVNYVNSIKKFTPDPYHFIRDNIATGANRAWKCMIVAKYGILIKDSNQIIIARDAMSPLFDYVVSSDGFYTDGSFIQHGAHPYTGAYGVSLLDSVAQVLYLLAGSQWAVTDPDSSHLYQWIYDSFEPLIYKGTIMENTTGRQISRSNSNGYYMARTVINDIITMALLAEEKDAIRLKSMAKYLIQVNTYQQYYALTNIFYVVTGKSIVADSSIQSRGNLSIYKQYSNMDRVIQMRPGYAFSVAMSSNRVYNYESIEGENLKGWHTGDGMTYLYNDDTAQYMGEFWPTVDWYRLPGTTVEANTTLTQSNKNGSKLLNPTDDAYVLANAPNNNYGKATEIPVKGDGGAGYTRHAYLKFDLRSLTLPGGIVSAKLRIKGNNTDASDASVVPISIFNTSDSWTEGNITWTNAPNPIGSAVGILNFNNVDQYNEVDITSYLLSEYAGDKILSMELADNNNTKKYINMYSSQATTLMGKPELIITSKESWVGGTDMDDLYGITGMEINSCEQNLSGKKSWFMFDNEIVALGSDIVSDDNKVVETIIENRKIRTTQTLTVNGTSKPTNLGWNESMNLPTNSWIHLSGNTVGSDIGYFFPNASTVNGLRESRTGAWSDINTSGSTTKYKNDFMELWFDHGNNAITSSSYSYVLLPNMASAKVSSYAASPDITILENSSGAHAVKENTLNILGVNFWANNKKSIAVNGDNNYITCYNKASIMVKDDGNDIEISTSDPTQQNTGAIQLELNMAAENIISKDSNVTVIQTKPKIILSIGVNGSHGKAFKVHLSKEKVLIASTIRFLDQQGSAASLLSQNTSLIVNVKVDNGYLVEKNATLAVAMYSSIGKLEKICIDSEKIDALSTRTLQLQFDVPKIMSGYFVKAFAWGDLQEMHNLCTSSILKSPNVTEKINPVADSYVYDANSSHNWGTSTLVAVKQQSGATRHSYFKFDLNPLSFPNGIALAKFRIKGYNTNDLDTTKIPINIFNTSSDSWNEGDINWDNAPVADGNTVGTMYVNNVDQYYEADVTDYIKSQYAGDKIVSIELMDSAATKNYFNFYSRESVDKPELILIATE